MSLTSPEKITSHHPYSLFNNNNNNSLHLYSAFLCTQSLVHRRGIPSTTTNVQHPPGWHDGTHSVPEPPPPTHQLQVESRCDEANQCMRMIRSKQEKECPVCSDPDVTLRAFPRHTVFTNKSAEEQGMCFLRHLFKLKWRWLPSEKSTGQIRFNK